MELVSEKELILLLQLRDRISDLHLPEELLHPKNLARWLRARKHNLSSAEQMIRKNHLWLKEVNIEALVKAEDPPGWSGPGGQYPWYFSGYDHDENIVIVYPCGAWDVRHAITTGQRTAMLNYTIKLMHLGWTACLAASKNKAWMTQFVAIYDFAGLSFSQVSCLGAIQVTMQVAQIFDANYPELLRKGFILNTPLAFQLFYKLIRPALDERTANKLVLLGQDRAVWRKEIGAVVPTSQFPRKYGGDGDDSYLKMTLGPDGKPCQKS